MTQAPLRYLSWGIVLVVEGYGVVEGLSAMEGSVAVKGPGTVEGTEAVEVPNMVEGPAQHGLILGSPEGSQGAPPPRGCRCWRVPHRT